MKADTIEELADKMGFTGADKDNFVATVARYNELYDKQNDEDFGKPASRLSAIRTAPFYGCWLGASLLCSMQGISITENCQAKDSNNEPIPGLNIPGTLKHFQFIQRLQFLYFYIHFLIQRRSKNLPACQKSFFH